MQGIIKNIYADKIAAWSFNTSMGICLLALLAVVVTYTHLPPFLPLYNKMAWGYNRLGNRWEIYIPFLFVFACIWFNTYLGLRLQQRIPLLARFLFITSLSVSIFTAIFIGKILFIII